MVSIGTVIEIIGLLIVVSTTVGTFYAMQTRQNMKIKDLDERVKDLRKEVLEEREKRIELSESVIEIKKDLEHILEALQELKDRPNC